ncbi:uncharacterized protein MELLADRAFT_61970 [Melampsora larici-populina 98AG31]|uniref:Uncharacterized protein n=1 Tax=Melampsora larici-populina (strain 98AG31 / pathotype 3-4-7) TaxID=747676 RepID=F4RHG8_MELLP|nr:uncharacterized protein MELLADRAFT_61970 [Melampsora larici-populina 98AG31]EGG08168.1 hypothetical protein MELLADRAFT_61970 [Melampsora larici-populina 98AG31]
MLNSVNPIPTSNLLEPKTPWFQHEIVPQACPLFLDSMSDVDLVGAQKNQLEKVKGSSVVYYCITLITLPDLSISQSHQLFATLASNFNKDISMKQVEDNTKQVQDLETRALKLQVAPKSRRNKFETLKPESILTLSSIYEVVANMEVSFNLLNTQAGICTKEIITNKLALDGQLAQIRSSQIECNAFMATKALQESCVHANKVMNFEVKTTDLQQWLDLTHMTAQGHRRVLQQIIDALHLDINIAEEINIHPVVENNPPLPDTPSTGND